ncbi:MAG: amino acid adenylation domain-containing protein [Aquabacterium sp.]
MSEQGLDAAAPVDYDPFAEAALARVVPTTEAQREVWLASQLGAEASLAYNESLSIRIRGVLDRDVLGAALNDLVARHESLRATLSSDGETLQVAAEMSLPVAWIDGSTLDGPAREAEVALALRRAVTIPFDLAAGPLARAELLRLDPADHVLVFTAHHVVCDGWSFGILVQNLADLYARRCGVQRAPGPPAVSFADHALALHADATSADHAEDEAYWVTRFSGLLPVLDLPTDRPRAARRQFESQRVEHPLDAPLSQAVRSVSMQGGGTLFGILLAAFGAMLHRLGGGDEVVIGVPFAGQSLVDDGDLVGHCVQLLPLRFAVDRHQPLPDLARSVQGVLYDAFDHPRVGYGALLKKLAVTRDPSRLPLVSVMFNLDQPLALADDAFPGARVDVCSNPRAFENFELFVNIAQVGAALQLECQFNAALFDATTVQRWLRAYESLLRGACDGPGVALGQLPFASTADQQSVRLWNQTQRPYPERTPVHALFEQQVDRVADRVAVVVGDRKLTYAQLDHLAQAVADKLRGLGTGPGDRVGLLMSRGAGLLPTLLGTLKTGAAYVPLDPTYPVERLRFMMDDADLRALVTDVPMPAGLTWPEDRLVRVNPSGQVEGPPSAEVGPKRWLGDGGGESAAYMIYTSGSTGRPKGVVLPHRAVVNYLHSVAAVPGVNEMDCVAAVTTLSFDIAVSELLLPLTLGAKVVLAPAHEAADGALLRRLLETSQASWMQATPSTWQLLLQAGWRAPAGFRAWSGGEALPVELARRLRDAGAVLWNLYGPTETTVWSTCERVGEPGMGVGIGRPLDNTQVWVLDPSMQPCPVGVPGELYIGGEGVAIGYHRRPDLTRERFVDDPFASRPGARLYRTGDRGRWRQDGRLEHLGRLDHQVKLRGFRIELGEVEAAVLAQRQVAACVAVVRNDGVDDARLVAYVEMRPGVAGDPGALRQAMAALLPPYMLPQHLVLLPQIPRLPNGKVDRAVLPAPGHGTGVERRRVAAQTPTEAAVLAAMEAVLGLPGLGVTDHFFHLGGHSLLAARLAMVLARSCGRAVPLRSIFDAPTARDLARWLDQQAVICAHEVVTIERRADQTVAPLSLMQERLWIVDQLNPGRAVYNEPQGDRLIGSLDESALEAAFREVVRRQDALRTVLELVDGVPQQRVLPDVPVVLFPAEDLSHLDEVTRERTLAARMRQLSSQPLDLLQAPLWRLRLFRLGPKEHVMYLMVHHIVWDGWSIDVFYNEIAALYAAFSRHGPSPLPPLPLSYGDFASWQRHEDRLKDSTAQLRYWKERLKDVSEPLALPLDKPRPAVPSGAGETVWIDVPRPTADALRALGQRSDATVFMVLLTLYVLLLAQQTRQRVLVIGTPVRGRPVPELERVMGFFVNTLPLRLEIDPAQSFQSLLTQVRQVVLEAFQYPDVPFEQLVRELRVVRDESRFPVYQTIFSFQQGRTRPTRWGDLQHRPSFVHRPTSAWDLGLWFLERDEGLRGGLIFSTDLLTESTALRLRDHYMHLVDQVLLDDTQPLQRLMAASEPDRALLASWNTTRRAYRKDQLVHQLFESQARSAPLRPALAMGARTWTYAELDAAATRVAAALRRMGLAKGALVGLHLPRGMPMVAALLGVLKTGAAYVPMDPAYPPDRLRFMTEDAALAAVVTHVDEPSDLAWAPQRRLVLDDALGALEADDALPTTGRVDETGIDIEQPAYVIYTSGSTGRPKGVVVPHRSVLNYLQSIATEPGLGPQDRLLAVTTLSFDIAVTELLGPLSVGAMLVLATREQAADGIQLRNLMEGHQITLMQATPTTWQLLLHSGWQAQDGFRAWCGGEPLTADLAQRLRDAGAQVWNLYGPTETTVWSTCAAMDDPRAGIRIGRPLANTTVHVLDDRMQPLPVGVPGEICIGGDGVALGYLNRPELTAERFVHDPFDARPGASLYRTGDRGRWMADGQLEHMGRADFQVKLRGHRIELGEIEAALVAQDGVVAAIASTVQMGPDDVRLVAHLIMADGQPPPAAALQQALARTLPAYMVPQHLMVLAALPLLPNGKVNRLGLPSPLTQVRPPHGEHAALTGVEAQIGRIWCDLLKVPVVGRGDNFFDLGGHSLLAMQAIHRIRTEVGLEIGVRRIIFETLEQLAATLALPAEPAATGPAPAVQRRSGLLGRLASSWRGDKAG